MTEGIPGENHLGVQLTKDQGRISLFEVDLSEVGRETAVVTNSNTSVGGSASF